MGTREPASCELVRAVPGGSGVIDVLVSPSSVITELCDVSPCRSDGEFVEPRSFYVRYTSLIATLSHDNNNHRTSKHASTSWRSDGSPSCLGGSSHGWVPVKTHSTPVPTSVGRLWVAQDTPIHNNEPKKTQHDNNIFFLPKSVHIVVQIRGKR